MLLVRINTPSEDVANAIAEAAVERRLAACANLTAPIQSVYRWQGQIERAEEIPVLLKTQSHHFAAIEVLVRELHPDETPAILAIPVERSTADFTAWLAQETGG